MANSLIDRGALFCGACHRTGGSGRDGQIEKSFLLALGRLPRAEGRISGAGVVRQAKSAEALTRLAVVLFNLNEFTYLE